MEGRNYQRDQGREALHAAASVNQHYQKHDFLIEEWKATRTQVHLVLQAIWKFEAATILGLGGFYAWFITRQRFTYPAFDDLSATFLALIPAAMAIAVLHRLKIEYSILIRLATYTRYIEDRIYRGVQMPHGGWETYLFDNSGDAVSWGEFRTKYRNAFIVFSCIVGLSIFVFVLFAWQARDEACEIISTFFNSARMSP